MSIKIVIGADHRGFAHKEYLKKIAMIDGVSIEWIDVGTDDEIRSDYPLFAQRLCLAMRTQKIDHGILICASGGGMAVAANRFKGIYAVVAWNIESAIVAVTDDHANVLVIPSEFVKDPLSLVSAWLQSQPKGGRYQERIAMIDQLGGI